jgi:CRISPR type I-A-associated protein Csa5
MITLYTPATGLPDLEAKIAYGLARVGIEAYGSENVVVKEEGGFYAVEIDGRMDILDEMLNLLLRRLLASPHIPSSTPGITGRTAESICFDSEDMSSLSIYREIDFTSKNTSSEALCRHKGKKISNVIGLSASTSYHHRRDGLDVVMRHRPTNPKKICKDCGMVSLLGMWYASFIFSIKNREVFVIPIPKGETNGERLIELFSLQHHVRNWYFNLDISQVVIPLLFLSKIPSSADILYGFELFIGVLSRPQGYHVDGLFMVPIDNYLRFLKDNPYNIASIDLMVKKEATVALEELNHIVYANDSRTLGKFARIYIQQTSTSLYPPTSKYLLKEVAMIKQEIVENEALQSLARTLRYFVRERKYQYADNIRNARKEARDFEETIAKMLREGELRRVQQEEDKKKRKEIKNWIYLPKEDEIKEVFKLANECFEEVKLTLVTLAFSFPEREEEQRR